VTTRLIVLFVCCECFGRNFCCQIFVQRLGKLSYKLGQIFAQRRGKTLYKSSIHTQVKQYILRNTHTDYPSKMHAYIHIHTHTRAYKQADMLGPQFEGHTDSIKSVAISGNSMLIASGSRDKTVKIWCANTARLLCTLQDHKAVTCVHLNTDGTQLISGGEDKTVKLWHLQHSGTTATAPKTLTEHKKILKSVKFSPNNKKIASACHEEIIVCDAESGSPLQTFAHGGCFAWSPDSKFIAGGHQIHIWDIATGTELQGDFSSALDVKCVAFGANMSFVVTLLSDKRVEIRDICDGNSAAVIRVLEPLMRVNELNLRYAFALSPDEDFVALATREKRVRVLDFETGQLVQEFQGHTDVATDVAWSPNGHFIVSAGQENVVRIWRPKVVKVCMYVACMHC
jgi:WD40 repeat protein